MRNKRYPNFPDDADYNTNAPSYYDDLARKQKLIELLSKKIWDYDERLDQRIADLEEVLASYLTQWDERIENLDDEVSHIFVSWLNDGTLEQIINHDVLGNKADQEEVTFLADHLQSLSINVKSLPKPYVSAKGDGVTDDTLAIQQAVELLEERYQGLIERDSGYIAYAYPEIIFPSGIYLVNDVVLPRWVTLKGNGKAVIQSKEGNATKFSGFFTDSIVTHLHVKDLKFLYYDTCFRIQTNNADQSFITFEDVSFTKMNLFIDTVSYSASRSTIFNMTRCNASYDVGQIGRIFTDKATFKDNWFNHSSNGSLFYIDSLALFDNNMWIPTITGNKKVWVEFDATDHARSLTFISERFSGEGGACSIVLVKNVNKNNTNSAYRNQGISFKDCEINIINQYNPDNITGEGVRHAVIIDSNVDKNRSLNYITFENCLFSPDLSGGMVGSYRRNDILNYIPDTFSINFDYPSTTSATNGSNKIVNELFLPYTKIPDNFQRELMNGLSNGRLKVENTDISGTKKVRFKLKFSTIGANIKPHSYVLSLIAQGDSRYASSAYVSTAHYILDVSGGNDTTSHLKINHSKLHSSVSGAGNGVNPNITSVKFVESGTEKLEVSGSLDRAIEIEIEFGTNMSVGNAYLKPMFDFSLLT